MTARALLLLTIACVALCRPAFAGELQESVFTADLPFDASRPLPSWMHGPPVSAPGTGTRIAFSLSPPEGRDLLVHLVFDESDASALRVEWLRDGQSSPEVIAADLGEGLGVANQRPLLISASRLGGNGTLLLQAGEKIIVNRVRFEWVSERTMLASAAQYVPVVVTASRLALAEIDVDGSPRPALQDEWRGRLVRAALTEKAELLSPSVELVAALEQAPEAARFEASVAGVFLDQEVWLVVNGQEIGPLAIEVPTLVDPGYLGSEGRENEFAGWRRASAHLPAHVLLPGENSILLQLRSPLHAGYQNRSYVRDAAVELFYPPAPRQPDLSLPVSDVPAANVSAPAAEATNSVSAPEGSAAPADVLSDFWDRTESSL